MIMAQCSVVKHISVYFSKELSVNVSLVTLTLLLMFSHYIIRFGIFLNLHELFRYCKTSTTRFHFFRISVFNFSYSYPSKGETM